MKTVVSAALLLSLVAPPVLAETRQATAVKSHFAEEEGWHWYKDPAEDDTPPPPAPVPPPSTLTPTQQKKRLHDATMAALDKAILYPTVENYAAYMRLQNFWTEQATKFVQVSKQARLAHPELDYNLVRSHYNGTAGAQRAIQKTKESAAVSKLAREYGVMFFYRGNNPVDNLMAGVIKAWCTERGISLVAVSVDGRVSEHLPRSRRDRGQARAMGVRFFPATFMVDPRTRHWQPLAWGFMSHEDLDHQVTGIFTHFKADF
ncbi:type-F conjugative transfer system pilin assembly protein TraF [Klebsiella aerogenes]|uniref:type-F conjugative transfer system pilin assembly protein TraF n=1 Tax=Klebsiella aerogenes TaxID=548 RepID=UPI002E31D516|nr:type-F conjugative transfer system pilin assembly protein TraF [Klebsiella aerogenes]MED7793169.1 type-F conjugative transfer system pilin assembly protein TraF [Klebsiella aerogenes]